jgi:hypothetical protein
MLSSMPGLPSVRYEGRPESIVSLSPRWLCRLATASVMRNGRRTLQVGGNLCLPVDGLTDEVAEVLSVRCVHHVEVVSSHDTEAHVLLAT